MTEDKFLAFLEAQAANEKYGWDLLVDSAHRAAAEWIAGRMPLGTFQNYLNALTINKHGHEIAQRVIEDYKILVKVLALGEKDAD
jgi:hypothetical protein